MYLLDDTGVVRYQNLRGAALQKAVDELVAESLTRLPEQLASDNESVRSMAAFRIGRSALKNAAELLTPLTTDQSIMVKTRAAVGLALVSDELASDLRSLVRTAATDKNPIVSAAAFDVLSHSGDAELLKLATAAFDNTQPMIVQVAAQKPSPHSAMQLPSTCWGRVPTATIRLWQKPPSSGSVNWMPSPQRRFCGDWLRTLSIPIESPSRLRCIATMYLARLHVFRRFCRKMRPYVATQSVLTPNWLTSMRLRC